MLLAYLAFFVVSLAVFVFLRKFRLLWRITVALLLLTFLCVAFTVLVLTVADSPPKDSVPVTQEMLDRGGVTEEEWEAFEEEQKEQQTP